MSARWVAAAIELGGDFLLGEGIKLVEEDDGGCRCLCVFLRSALQFVADFAGADQDALGFSRLRVSGNDVQETLVREVFDGRTGIGMAQHALGHHYRRAACGNSAASGGVGAWKC